MEIICHRKNTIDELKQVPVEYGVEIDIRTYGGTLVMHHDPYFQGEKLEDWLAFYQHRTLILNVKEDGLESDLIRLMKKFHVNEYFFLDMAFPAMVKAFRDKMKRMAVRFSEYESVESVLAVKEHVDWVWVDCFNGLPLNPSNYSLLKKSGLKLCLVSPELVTGRSKDIPQYQTVLAENHFQIDAVCTKYPQMWLNFI